MKDYIKKSDLNHLKKEIHKLQDEICLLADKVLELEKINKNLFVGNRCMPCVKNEKFILGQHNCYNLECEHNTFNKNED